MVVTYRWWGIKMIHIKRSKRMLQQPSMIPLINVIFILLIFFMMAGKVERMDSLAINMPETYAGKQDDLANDRITVFVDAEGNLAVNKDLVAQKDFTTIIRTILLDSPHKPVYVKADENLSVDQLIVVMEMLEEAGATGISIFTQSES